MVEVLGPLLAPPVRHARARREAHVGAVDVAGARPRDGEPDVRKRFQRVGQHAAQHLAPDALAPVGRADCDALDQDEAVLANELAVSGGRTCVGGGRFVDGVACRFDE